jgi:hypothetical protein
MRRQACYVIAFAIVGGIGLALMGGSIHEAIRYGIALLTGTFIGLGLAGRSRRPDD